MPLFRQPRSPFWWYTFTFNGKRHRASTGETTKAKASTVEAAALTALARGEQSITKISRGATLRTLSDRFLDWVRRSTQLKDSTRRFYTYGWRLLSFSELANLRVDAITRDDVECTTFRRPVIDRRTKQETGVLVDCSPAYTNQALRTLKVMLGKAEEWGLIGRRPKFAAVKAPRRESLINGATEATLQAALTQGQTHTHVRRQRERAWLVVLILQDTGMRPNEVFRMRVEHVDWRLNQVWIPVGKTANARRFAGMSFRMREALEFWCADRTEGWVFPSRSKSGHLLSIAKGFRAACERNEVDRRIVPYSARHTYGTYTMGATKNQFAVSKAMGHANVQSMEPYQHPELGELNEAINHRNLNRDRAPRAITRLKVSESGHTSGHTTPTIH